MFQRRPVWRLHPQNGLPKALPLAFAKSGSCSRAVLEIVGTAQRWSAGLRSLRLEEAPIASQRIGSGSALEGLIGEEGGVGAGRHHFDS